MTNGLNYARLNFGVALRRNLNALWVDVAIASHTGITSQTFPSQRCELLPLNSGESQYLFLKLNDRVHDIKYSASGWWGITAKLTGRDDRSAPVQHRVSQSKNLNLRIASRVGTINCANHSRDLGLYARPACRSQNNDCNASRPKVLLMPEVLIGRDENLKPFSFCCVKQFAVLQRRPAALVCGRDFVLPQ
ncbi:MAG: hypothetical protein M3255_04830 [Pseudomonadota bacterium]|nr:hypothetical protein [Pseudomonadota bacterium]